MEIKNLKKAAKRILKAIKDREKIILYGDADIDGSASVIILKKSIEELGGKISATYFPDREIEGYGISVTGLKFLKKFVPALLVAVDCGIGNLVEVDLANKLGFEVIIVDHHLVLSKLPKAKIIVDPKQKGDKYPFKELAATGVVFKLAEVILGDKMTAVLRQDFLELTALATIADMMPQEEDNKIFIEQGLSRIEDSFWPGIKTFFEMNPFQDPTHLNQKISKLISILNSRDIKNGEPASFKLLNSSSKQESRQIIKKLLQENEIKKERIEAIKEEIEWQLSKKEESIIFLGSSQWEFSFIGLLASIFCNKYKKPTFIFKKGIKESRGSVRTPPGVNSVALMEKCSRNLLVFGGHPAASGFQIKNKNLEKFKACLISQLK